MSGGSALARVTWLFKSLAHQLTDTRRRTDRAKALLESRRELSNRYLLELQELIDGAEITPAVARRIREDLFEIRDGEQLPLLRISVWRKHRLEQTGWSDLYLVASNGAAAPGGDENRT